MKDCVNMFSQTSLNTERCQPALPLHQGEVKLNNQKAESQKGHNSDAHFPSSYAFIQSMKPEGQMEKKRETRGA